MVVSAFVMFSFWCFILIRVLSGEIIRKNRADMDEVKSSVARCEADLKELLGHGAHFGALKYRLESAELNIKNLVQDIRRLERRQ